MRLRTDLPYGAQAHPTGSLTLSARSKMVSGSLTPSAFAVVMLKITSNLAGCSIGRSSGPCALCRRIDNHKARKIFLVIAAVARQQPVALQSGVRPDQEVGDHTVAFSSAGAIFFPGDAGKRRSLLRLRGETDAESTQRSQEVFIARKCCPRLAPHDGARNHRARVEAEPQGSGRRLAETRIGAEHVDQDGALVARKAVTDPVSKVFGCLGGRIDTDRFIRSLRGDMKK